MNRAMLEEPFDPNLVRTRKGSFGNELSYVEAAHYIRRLNDALDGQWSFKILGHENHGTEVTVHGMLEAAGQVKHAFGNSTITVNKTTGEVVSLGDDLKAAATDALKKACSLFGIGLDLYVSDSPASRPKQKRQQTGSGNGRRGEGRGNGDNGHQGSDNGNGNGRNRLTAKQLRALYAISHSKGMTDAELKQEAITAYGVAPEFLSRSDASDLIESLNCL